MARKSTKHAATAQQPTHDTDGLREVRVIDFIGDVKDAYLDELRETQDAFRDPSKLFASDGVYFAFDPKRFFHDDGTFKESARNLPESVRSRLAEKIVFDPRTMAVPIGTGDEITKQAMEDRLWNNGSGNTIVSLGSVNLTQAQKQACGMYANHPLGKNIVRNLTTLTMGEGVTINWTPKDERKSGERTKEKWLKWETENRFQQFIRDDVRTAYVCGEVFTLWSEKSRTFGLVEPDRVDRIFYDTTSARKVVGYRVQQGYGMPPAYVSAADMWHLKFDCLGNVPRGIPRMLPVFVDMRRWSLFVENRHWVNMVRARIPLIFESQSSGAQIQTLKSRFGTIPGPGTTVFLPSNTKAVFPTHSIGASDVMEDRKLLESAIAAGVSMPIMLVTGDLSATYSSGVLQESPLVRDIEDSRDLIREMIEWMVSKVMNKTSEEFSVQYAPVVRRNFADVAAAAVALKESGIWSHQTACESTGKSWADVDGEQERITREESEGFMSDTGVVDPFQKQQDGGVGAPTTGTAMGGSSRTKAAGGDGEG